MDFIMEKIVIPIVVIILIFTVVFVGFSIYAGNVCVSNGYPDGYVVLPYEIKCGRIVNQTEYICSLDEVLSNSCFPK